MITVIEIMVMKVIGSEKEVDRKTDKTGKNDLLLIGLLVLAAAVFLGFRSLNRETGKILVITVGGEETVREELKAGKSWTVETEDGGVNLFIAEETEDGTLGVRCMESNCPEQVCVDKGFVSLTDDPIVCLPHRLTARLIEE